MSSKLSQNSQENTCARVFIKKTLKKLFSCEFCDIFNNTFFYRTPLVTASVLFEVSIKDTRTYVVSTALLLIEYV